MAKKKRGEENAQPAGPPPTISDLSEQVRQLGADQQQAFKADRAIYLLVTRATAPGSESKRAELAEKLAKELTAKKPDHNDQYLYAPPIRVKVARLLSFVATEKE